MNRVGRAAVVAAATAVTVVLVPTAAFSLAGDALQDCIDQGENHDGELPTCTEIDGEMVPSWPGEEMGGPGSGGVAALFVLVVLVGIAITVWRVSTARRLAMQSGMDPGVAGQMALLTENGLESTYLASHLRTPKPAPSAPTPERTTATERLTELKSLLEAELITQAEYDQRRRAIVDGL